MLDWLGFPVQWHAALGPVLLIALVVALLAPMFWKRN